MSSLIRRFASCEMWFENRILMMRSIKEEWRESNTSTLLIGLGGIPQFLAFRSI
jgi:hypothetical protein